MKPIQKSQEHKPNIASNIKISQLHVEYKENGCFPKCLAPLVPYTFNWFSKMYLILLSYDNSQLFFSNVHLLAKTHIIASMPDLRVS